MTEKNSKQIPTLNIAGKSVNLAVIAAVALALIIALVLIFTKVIVPNQKYSNALSLMDEGRYNEAIAAFDLMGDYKDSLAKIEECEAAIIENNYNDALSLLNAGNYEDAIAAFKSLGNYKDSESLLVEAKYNSALELYNAENYLEAGTIFKTLDYKDSAEKYAQCRATAPYDFTEIGDIITFGRYEQDNNDRNGPEELEWRVLDKQDGKVLIITDKAVEMLPYFAIYWKRSHIGGYLNSSFINDFTREEKAMMVEVTVTADKHPDHPETDQGSDTQHKLHLLSIDEVLKYFPEPEDRVCYATDYLIDLFQNTPHLDGLEENGTCDWWLRTAMTNYSSGAIISTVMGSGNFGWATHNCRLALRPVCWIQLEA